MKKPDNAMKIIFLSLSENERFARSAVGGFIASKDPRIDELGDLKTAVSEAVTNCIVHAYRDCIGTIELSARLYGDEVVIKVRDKGCGIEDVKKAMEPLYTTLPDEERSGLGFSVMESFCDSVSVKSRPGSGTTVTLTKKLGKRSLLK